MAREAKGFSDKPFETVALMGFAIAAGHRDPYSGIKFKICTKVDKNLAPRQTGAGTGQFLELAARTETRLLGKAEVCTSWQWAYALVNWTRPWRRRELIILRPLAVAILARKPLTDLRHRLLGWYVRFTGYSSYYVMKSQSLRELGV